MSEYPKQKIVLYQPVNASIIKIMLLCEQIQIGTEVFRLDSIQCVHSLQYTDTIELHLIITQITPPVPVYNAQVDYAKHTT